MYTNLQPFNSPKWSNYKFSLQYYYKIKQTSDENKKEFSKEIISWSNIKFSELKS